MAEGLGRIVNSQLYISVNKAFYIFQWRVVHNSIRLPLPMSQPIDESNLRCSSLHDLRSESATLRTSPRARLSLGFHGCSPSAKEALPPHHTSPTCRQRYICIIYPVLTRGMLVAREQARLQQDSHTRHSVNKRFYTALKVP